MQLIMNVIAVKVNGWVYCLIDKSDNIDSNDKVDANDIAIPLYVFTIIVANKCDYLGDK